MKKKPERDLGSVGVCSERKLVERLKNICLYFFFVKCMDLVIKKSPAHHLRPE